MVSIVNNIRSERIRLGLTQEDLAEKLGVSCSTIGEWEKGEASVKSSHVIAMSDLFGCTTDYLFALTDERTRTA